MKRKDEFEAKIDSLIKEYTDLSYEEIADILDYYSGMMASRANK